MASVIEARICTLEKTVAEHEVKLESACASLDRVAQKLDDVCDKLSRVIGVEASRAKLTDMMIGAGIAIFVGLVTDLL